MSKKKRSKIMAALLCATTMAAFYTAPKMVYAENLYFTADGTVTTNSAGNTPITDLKGLESITFGVVGESATAGVKFYMDTQYNGLVVGGGALTAEDLYITVQDTADGDNYNSNRYSLRNTLGIHRIGTGDGAVTNIEANSLGHGGMQVSSESVIILDGTATFTNTTTQGDGGTISFDGKFDSAQGMTVGSSFELTNAGKITKVTGIDVQGALITTGTINSMNIGNNQVNGVTLQSNNVTANIITGTDVTDGTYHLSQVGKDVADVASDVEELNEKTTGMTYSNGSTTFTSKVVAYGGLQTGNGMIFDGSNNSFSVSDAAEVIKAVNDRNTGLEATYDIASGTQEAVENKTTGLEAAHSRIDDLNDTVSTFDDRITTNAGDIATNKTAIEGLGTRVGDAETEIDGLQTVTTGMSYDNGVTTFDHKIAVTDITATTGTVGNVTFNGGVATDLTAIEGDSVTVAGTAISKGSFNGVSIANTDGKASINGISIYQDQGDYYVGNVNISDLTSGSGATVEGIVRTPNDESDLSKGYTTTIEGALAVNSATGDTTVTGTVTAKDFVIKDGASLSTVAANLGIAEGEIDTLQGTVSGHTTKIGTLQTDLDTAEANIQTNTTNITNLSGSVTDLTGRVTTAEGEIDTLQVNTANLQGTTLTNMTEIETDKITATEGTIGGISFETVSGEKTIGTADDTINLAGNAINKGRFNGVAIGVENGHATFNGVSIYEDTNNDNDVMVGGKHQT